MMKRLLFVVILAALLPLAGCFTRSIHSLYDDETTVFNPQLLGTWGDLEKSWTFKQGEDNFYRLVLRNDISMDDLQEVEGYDSRIIADENPDTDGIFEVHLVKLGAFYFLDFYPAESPNVNEMFLAHVLPVHSFAQVHITDDSLKIAFLDASKFEKGLLGGRFNLPHEEVDGTQVITAKTEDIQRFILNHVEELFDEPLVTGKLR